MLYELQRQKYEDKESGEDGVGEGGVRRTGGGGVGGKQGLKR